MRKLFLLLSLLLLSLSVSAQRIDKPNEPYFIYCLVIGANLISPTIYIGEDKEEYFIMKDNEEKEKFIMGNDIMTYMSKRGWDYVESVGASGYFFRKKVISDNEANANLILKYKSGKNKGMLRE